MDDKERKEAEKWMEAIRTHIEKCGSMSPECLKEIANERLSIRLRNEPDLPPSQWWP